MIEKYNSKCVLPLKKNGFGAEMNGFWNMWLARAYMRLNKGSIKVQQI